MGNFRQLRVLVEQLDHTGALHGGEGEALVVGLGEVFPVLRVGLGVGLVAVGLAGLREQNQGRGIRSLQTEREIEEDTASREPATRAGAGPTLAALLRRKNNLC